MSLLLSAFGFTSSTPSPYLPLLLTRSFHFLVAYVDGTDMIPFLVLNEKRKMTLFPLCKEAPVPCGFTSSNEILYASFETEFPLEKWVHVGCEIVGERTLPSPTKSDSTLSAVTRITLAGLTNDDGLQGYVHHDEVLLEPSAIKDHYVKDPPSQLVVDSSSASEIEEDTDGVWSIVGGKAISSKLLQMYSSFEASCCGNFSLDVNLIDAFGQPASKELEVVAPLIYADNGLPVEKPHDAEASLLTSYDGIEFAACDRPSKRLHGCASFKLKISQLSSKCDNRLIQIKFDTPRAGRYPFLEATSHPIRCISRNRNSRIPPVAIKRFSLAINPLNGSQSFGLDDGFCDIQHNIVNEVKVSPLSKRVRVGQERSSTPCNINGTLDQHDEECNSHAMTATQFGNSFPSSLAGRRLNLNKTDNSSSDSESCEARDSNSKDMCSRNSESDLTIFRYTLGDLSDRSLFLKEIANSSSDEEMQKFARQVSIFSGCSHHRRQILVAKRLIDEGEKAWNSITGNHDHVYWENVVFEIEQLFMTISSSSRSYHNSFYSKAFLLIVVGLTVLMELAIAHTSLRIILCLDLEFLRRLCGCHEIMSQENFDKLWRWLYPIAFTLSQDCVKAMWVSTAPKWIEGFVTKEEAEASLQGPGGLQDPGTFILRFPTSRSWPHPDAGSLVVTYVGSNFTVHHRLLALDYIFQSVVSSSLLLPLCHVMLLMVEKNYLYFVYCKHVLCGFVPKVLINKMRKDLEKSLDF
ncbi:hypothetical protein RJ641_034254 [Dillenia turbinata]|uniref:SH2 domain-containing protein n=1 Tax=Dillenia turbinata TaxID=194707 RepID=A0AAN8VM10_9MAGN